jgi:hypothetical protein
MSNNAFVPIIELREGSSDTRVAWHANLPEYVDEKRIGVNVRALGRLTQLAGLRDMTITSSEDSEYEFSSQLREVAHQTVPSREAGKNVLAPRLAQVAIGGSTFIPSHAYDFYWPKGLINLNVLAVADRVNDLPGEHALSDPSAWSGVMNRVLQEGLRESSRLHLLLNVPNQIRTDFLAGMAISNALLIAFEEVSKIPFDLRTLGVNALGIPEVYNLVVSPILAKFAGARLRDKRLSILPVWQLDRLAAVNVLSKTTKLVKQLPA